MADIISQTMSQIQSGLVNQIIATAFGVPALIFGLAIAALIIIVGWIIGKFLGGIVSKLLKAAQLDEWAKQHKLKEAVGGVELSVLAGAFVKWYAVLIFLTEAVAFVRMDSIRTFMNALIYYIPILLAALVIIVLGLLLAKFVRNKIEATQHKYKKTAARIAEVIIIYLSVVIGLKRVGIDVSILEYAFLIAFAAFVIVVALVLGISFGLAFKKDAKQLVNDLKREYA